MTYPNRNLDRRTFLNAAGACLVLPSLESLGQSSTLKATAFPTRFLAFYFPNGVYPTAWQSEMTPNGLKLGGVLAPLASFSEYAVTLSGMNHPFGGHLGQITAFLTGIELEMNSDGVLYSGTSLDQIIAQKIGADTYLPSIQFGMEPPSQGAFGNRPRSYGNSISWSSPTSKIEPQISPQMAFDQVFYGQSKEGRRKAARQKRLIDAVWSEAKSLQRQVSQYDRVKLEQYYDSIRDMEARLEKTIKPSEKSWRPESIPEIVRPQISGIPNSHTEHMRMLMDILVLALQTDSTRVATFVLGHAISRIVFDFADPSIKRHHHDLSHHANNPDKIAGYNIVSTWFAEQMAYLLKKMQSIPEGDGTLLDHSLVLYGSGMKDGNIHDPENVPMALFGSANGKIRTNQHIQCPEGSVLSNLHLTILHAFGIEAPHFNEITSKTINGLLA